MALTKITKQGVGADAIDATKIADDSISEEHLDVTAITGNTELSAVASNDDVLLIFDTSAGVIKKIQRSNVALEVPSFTAVSPTTVLSGDGTGNHTFTITGTKFDATPVVTFLRDDTGVSIDATSTTRNSATQLTVVIPKSSLPDSGEPYDVVITNASGLATTATNQISINAAPAFVTAAGSVGTVAGGSAMTPIDVVAADPESAGTVTFDIITGGLPLNLSGTTVHENGVSKFRISGTPVNPSGNTSTNFTLRASDAASNTSTRSFTITVSRSISSTSFTSSGTFAVPSGTSNLTNVLVVAGGGSGGAQHAGGGGAGGLIFMPCVPVTPGGTIAVTVGCGGAMSSTNAPALVGQDSVFGASPSPGISAALTAKGGGRGGSGPAHAFSCGSGPGCMAGGSGGGMGYAPAPAPTKGTATQPTQSGNSGAYGFGNDGGTSPVGYPSGCRAGGGGGGAGAAGSIGGAPQGGRGGVGGAGKAYTIADGTTPVYYAGGGGGGGHSTSYQAPGGQGGGGAGGNSPPPGGASNATLAGDGSANKGGGGGALFYGSTQCAYASSASPNIPAPGANQGRGGKGIVIVRF